MLDCAPKKSISPYGLNLTEFSWGNEAWCALDAPGPNEALAHAQHALVASDACILCVSPVPEEAVLAAPYLRIIEASGTPCILFVNRMDEPRGRLRDVIAALQDYANHTLLRISDRLAHIGCEVGGIRQVTFVEQARRLIRSTVTHQGWMRRKASLFLGGHSKRQAPTE